MADLLIRSANIPLPNTGGVVWELVMLPDTNLFELDIAAKIGDRVSIGYSGMRTGADAVDIAVVTGGLDPVVVRYMATLTVTPAADGDTGWYASGGGPFFLHSTNKFFTVTSGDLDDAKVRFVVTSKGGGTSVIEGDADNSFYMVALNIGAAPS